MKQLTRTVVVLLMLLSSLYADQLEVKFSGKDIKLPYWPAEKKAHGAVVLIHGQKEAQWSLLLAQLAERLSNNGWSVVLVNCAADPSGPWIKSLPEVVNVLQKKNLTRIIIAHYGDELKQLLTAYDKAQNTPVKGLILISAYNSTPPNDKKEEIKPLEIPLPVLDLVGQFDYAPVFEQFKTRKNTFSAPSYLPVILPGAYHDYEYSQNQLLAFMRGWMLHLPITQPAAIDNESKPAQDNSQIPNNPASVAPTTPKSANLTSFIAPMEPLMPKQVAYDESDWNGMVYDPEAKPEQEIDKP